MLVKIFEFWYTIANSNPWFADRLGMRLRVAATGISDHHCKWWDEEAPMRGHTWSSFLRQDLQDFLDLFCISPFPDGREKIQSRPWARKGALTSHYWNAVNPATQCSFLPSKRHDIFCLSRWKAKKYPDHLVNPVWFIVFLSSLETVEPFQFSPLQPMD